MQQEYALILAWPETKCKQAGAWYDGIMNIVGFSKKGYYKVGHAAIVLIDSKGKPFYFDFGRYHAPFGKGRVRDVSSDYDLALKTAVLFDEGNPQNMDELIIELQAKKACHGDGKLEASLVKIDFNKAFEEAKKMQSQTFISYGPFIYKGTNCSRFVKSVAHKGMSFSFRKLFLNTPLMLTPTPMWNVRIGKKQINNVYEDLVYKEEIAIA